MDLKNSVKFEFNFIKCLFLISFLFLVITHSNRAYAVSKITWATEVWENFSQKNGQGLYHELIDNVFAIEGVAVEKQFVPFKRALKLVERENADITGGIRESAELLLSDTAILVTGISVLYKGNKEITSFSDLRNLVGTWPQKYEKEFFTKELLDSFVGFPSTDRAICLNHVLTGKADYYIDAIGILENHLVDMEVAEKAGLTITNLKPVYLKMAFTNSVRGEQIKEIFERGIQQLHDSGKLKKIYQKYKRSYVIAP